MKEYNYKNLADESNFGSQVYRAGMFDKILGISKTAKEAANQVIPSPVSNETNAKELFLPIIGELSKFITRPICFPNNEYWYNISNG